jgi:hypothetical protein
MDAAHLRTYSINGPSCSGGVTGVEGVSNSIATDENGGVYIVTSHAMYRVNGQAGRLLQAWRSSYGGAGMTGGGRIGSGSGSGSTPTLMGTHAGDSRFVVITDGTKLMNLDLMCRDQIPRSWKPLRPGASRRIDCEVPMTFGNPAATESLSEQSVVVRGNSAIVVNNRQRLNRSSMGCRPSRPSTPSY